MSMPSKHDAGRMVHRCFAASAGVSKDICDEPCIEICDASCTHHRFFG